MRDIREYIKIIEMTPTLLISTKILTESSFPLCSAYKWESKWACLYASRKLLYFNVNYRNTSRARTNRRTLEANSVRARYLKYHANDIAL